MNKLNIYYCPICGSVTISYGKPQINCCGTELQTLVAETATTKPVITEMDGEYLLEFDCPMTKDNYIAAVVVERYDQATVYRLFAEQAAQVRVPQVAGTKIYVISNNHNQVKTTLIK